MSVRISQIAFSTSINILIKLWWIFPELNIGRNFSNRHVYIVCDLHKNFLHGYLVWNIFTSERICPPMFYFLPQKPTACVVFPIYHNQIHQSLFFCISKCLLPVFTDSRKCFNSALVKGYVFFFFFLLEFMLIKKYFT